MRTLFLILDKELIIKVHNQVEKKEEERIKQRRKLIRSQAAVKGWKTRANK